MEGVRRLRDGREGTWHFQGETDEAQLLQIAREGGRYGTTPGIYEGRSAAPG